MILTERVLWKILNGDLDFLDSFSSSYRDALIKEIVDSPLKDKILKDSEIDAESSYYFIMKMIWGRKIMKKKFMKVLAAALVAGMFNGTITVSNDISAMPATTNCTVTDLGNLK